MTSWYRDFKTETTRTDGHKTVDSPKTTFLTTRRPDHRFDFDVGYLIKSPCRECEKRREFPGCDETCDTLDKIHLALCDSVSCTKHK